MTCMLKKKFELPLNIGIPVGSGFKHQIRVVSGNSEHPTSSNIYVLKVPYIYTIPGISTRDFEHSVDIVLDFRQNGTTCRCFKSFTFNSISLV